MPGHSIYKGKNGQCYNPDTFIKEFNKHGQLNDAAETMGISKSRLSVIACRLRKRGYCVKMHPPLNIAYQQTHPS